MILLRLRPCFLKSFKIILLISALFRTLYLLVFLYLRRMKNVAVILSGGVGARVGGSTPKQFLKLGHRTIIEHVIATFESHPLIDEIWVVMHPDFMEHARQLLCTPHFSKVKEILKGGSQRSDSTWAAINAVPYLECNILLHDAARPLVSHRIIDDVIAKLASFQAISVAIPVVDTMIRCENNTMVSVVDRSQLMQVQTPQGFRFSTLKKAYQCAQKDPYFIATDDCSVVKKYLQETQIFVVTGDEKNRKLTYPEDIVILEQWLKEK